jgi:hypothetical protein
MDCDELDQKYSQKFETLTPFLIFVAAITIFTFGFVCYHIEKTNERLLRLEKIVNMDEIGRRR